MSDSAEAIFPDQAAPAAEAPVVEPTPTEQAPVIEAAPAEETPPPAQTPEAAPEPTQDRFAPIAALLDERDQKKAEREARIAAERERDELRAKLNPPADMPDPYADPQGFRQKLREEFQSEFRQALNAERLNTSYRVASVRYGPEVVEGARMWAIDRAQKDPAFSTSLDMQSDPVDWIVHQHKRDGLLSQIGDKSLEDFIREQVASDPAKYGMSAPVVAATPPSAVIAQPALKAAVPPRSIASDATAPAAATDPSADFMAIFRK